MQQRYALRFENGERRGETIPITGGGITVGRKSGNSVQILDASVSGRHAEVILDGEGVLVRDLGSTNGTRVGSERVSEQRLAHADAVLFGNVRMTFLDTSMSEVPPASADALAADVAPVGGAPAGGAGEGMRSVSAEQLARSRKTSVTSLVILLLAIVAAAAGGWFWLQGRAGSGPVAQVNAVEPVAGNLLSDGYSFEGEGTTWEADDAHTGAFALDSVARRSGAQGFSATLGANESALSRSRATTLSAKRSLRAAGYLRSEGDVELALGLEFSSSTNGAATTIAWSLPVRGGGDFELVELGATAPPAYDTARVVARALAQGQGGSADLDDVSLTHADGAPAPAGIDEYQLFTLGTPSTAAVLHKIDRTLLSGIAVLEGARALALNVAAREDGFTLSCGDGSGRKLALHIEPALAQLGVATLGAGGYRTHNVEFSREAAAGLLLGAGKDLINVEFDPPAAVSARPEGGGYQVEVALGNAASFGIQLVFRAERDAAQNLARDARNAEAAGTLGASLALWAKLRDEYPFETALLTEADATRGRLADAGFSEIRALRQELENARFFRLRDIFRNCRTRAQALAQRFDGSDTAREASQLVVQIDAELAVLEAEVLRAEAARLEGIAKALTVQKNPELAARVREYLAQQASATSSASKSASGGAQ